MRRPYATLVTAVCSLLSVSPAGAADVVTPQSGEEIASRPIFTFDFTSGRAIIEFSRSRDVKTAGDDIGAFVDPHADDSISIGGDVRPPYIFDPIFPVRLAAGDYYWHAKLDDYADDGPNEPPLVWGPTRTTRVRDEPVVFEGWTVRTQRLASQQTCRGTRMRLAGKIVWSDNDRDPTVRYSLRVAVGRRVVGRARGVFEGSFGSEDFDTVACLRSRGQLTITPVLVDNGGHVVVGPPRKARA